MELHIIFDKPSVFTSFSVGVGFDTARRCRGEDADDVDDVVRSRDTETRVGKRSECSHSYDFGSSIIIHSYSTTVH